jgi:hypothetical protein
MLEFMKPKDFLSDILVFIIKTEDLKAEIIEQVL